MSERSDKADLVTTSALTTTWGGGRDGSGTVRLGDDELPVSLPAAFGGRGLGASPEDLLAAAVSTCFAATLGMRVLALGATDPRVVVRATAELERSIPPRLTALELGVRLALTPPADGPLDEAGWRALVAAAKAQCLVSRALQPNVDVRLGPVVIESSPQRKRP
jgi:osmotically inducible protein OsmC